jgi:hypothetical protein
MKVQSFATLVKEKEDVMQVLSKNEKIKKSEGFALEMQKRCRELDLTPKDVAGAIGRAYDVVRKVYKGETFPGPNLFKQICEYLKMDEEEMRMIVDGDRAIDKGWVELLTGDDPIISRIKTYWNDLSKVDQQEILDMVRIKAEKKLRRA